MLSGRMYHTLSSTTATLFLLLFCVSFLQLASITAAISAYPCHASKKAPNFDVQCTTVQLPPSLCLSCGLRPPAADGSFIDCNNIFDTSSSSCHNALQQYVDQNPCDHARKAALTSFLSDNTDDSARSILDYFLYSICENCCDCVPMGRTASDYDALLASHTKNEPMLWKEDRGNCPAHAVYDVCKVLPNIQLFTGADTPDQGAPAACPALNVWLSSSASSNWAANPETQISNQTRTFLRSLLEASNCKNRQVWTRCHDLEESQGNLDLPGGSTLPPVTTSPPTTVAPTMTATNSPTQISSPSMSVSETSSITSSPSISFSSSTTRTPLSSPPPSLSSVPAATATSSVLSSATPVTDAATVPPEESTSVPPETSDDTSMLTVLPSSDDTDSDGSGRNTSTEMETMTSSPDDDPENDGPSGEATCFPWDAMVDLEGGTRVTMAQLRVGDRVRVSSKEFSEVFVFTHRDRHSIATRYLELKTCGNLSVTMTESHLIYVSRGAMEVGKCRRGDSILTVFGWQVITSVRDVTASGLYNPQTLHGDIVVNGVVASTFTTAVKMHAGKGLLSPLRALYRVGLVGEEFWERMFTSTWWLQVASVWTS